MQQYAAVLRCFSFRDDENVSLSLSVEPKTNTYALSVTIFCGNQLEILHEERKRD